MFGYVRLQIIIDFLDFITLYLLMIRCDYVHLWCIAGQDLCQEHDNLHHSHDKAIWDIFLLDDRNNVHFIIAS